MPATVLKSAQTIYWHRELPPLYARPLAEHTLEAVSRRVPDSIAHREELWTSCRDDLVQHVNERLNEEIARLGGRYAHVLDEVVDTRHDAATGEAWLHGRYRYMLYE